MNITTECRSCGAPIIWARTQKGKAIPMDPEPTEGGNIIIRMGPKVGQKTAHVETKQEREARLASKIDAARTAYVSHYATCPDADKWRKRKTKD